jgi:Cu-processing system ATP-binding protein|nr:MAG: ABC transporter [Bacteroidota bacterium]
MIELRGVSKRFGSRLVLRNVGVTFRPGEVTALIGPNGSGKTTLLKSIVGLVQPDTGQIFLNGVPLDGGAWACRDRIGYLSQVARFPENLTVQELVAMLTMLRRRAPERLQELRTYFRLESVWDKPLRILSGGTRQRVALLLAWMFDPEVLLLDEPTAGLDPVAAARLKDLILQERERGKVLLLTTHVLAEVEELADQIVFLLDGEVHFAGSPEELLLRTGESTVEGAIVQLLDAHTGGVLHVDRVIGL